MSNFSPFLFFYLFLKKNFFFDMKSIVPVKKYQSCAPVTSDYRCSLKQTRRMKSMNNLPCHSTRKLPKRVTLSQVEVSPKILKLVEGLPTLEETRDAWGYIYETGNSVLTLDRKLNGELHAGQVAGYLIGTDEPCDIKTRYDDAPKRHALIYASPRIQDKKHVFAVFIQDLSTRSIDGVWVNYKNIGKNVFELTSKDIIHFRDPLKFTSNKINPSYTFIKPIKTSLSFSSFSQLYYRIKGIGTGTYGIVSLAICKSTGKRVAIKEVRLCKNQDAANVKKRVSLLREISVCMALPVHPCIIQTNKVFEEDDKIYLVMEYGYNGDLFTNVAEPVHSSLREFEVKIIFEQIAHAISYLHEHGVVHRDIKMENVIICDRKQLRAKLCDFGLSTFSKQGESLYSSCGTIMYAAPEVLNSSQDDYKGYGMEVDIWSLGVLLYSALTNSTPFLQMEIDDEENKKMLKSHILNGDFNFDHSVWKEISKEAKDLVKCTMEINAKERYTINQVLNHPWLQDVENELTRESGVYRNPEMVEYLARRNNSSCSSL
ncbi:kinase-like domain-containing protein [Helicostylum pulchrum]|nr:kinase-like domain-containing protein [Helicostylum pulchrum]